MNSVNTHGSPTYHYSPQANEFAAKRDPQLESQLESTSTGITDEGRALLLAMDEIEAEAASSKPEQELDSKQNPDTDNSYSLAKGLTAAATIGGILLAVV